MNVEVRIRDLESTDELLEHAVREAHLHLSRFGQDVTSVVVRLSDVNGPKGGVDKRCHVTVRGPRFGSSTREALSGDARSSLDAAIAQTARAVGRELERTRTQRNRGRSLRRAS